MIGATVALVGVLLWPLTGFARAQTYVQSEKLRFRLIGDEPIASPDGRTVVSGFKVVVLRDTRSDQCYVTFISGSAMSTTGPSVCP
jgi:hypothetical protein